MWWRCVPGKLGDADGVGAEGFSSSCSSIGCGKVVEREADGLRLGEPESSEFCPIDVVGE